MLKAANSLLAQATSRCARNAFCVALADLSSLGIPLPICVDALCDWRATELFGVTDSEQLIPDDDEAPEPDGLGLTLRICLVLFLVLIFWQAMLLPWTP